MFCPLKNSYLQLVCAINPRVINKAVDEAMRDIDPDRQYSSTLERLESGQPSLFAPQVDITRKRMGFERVGLKILIRELHSPDFLKQLQAIHSILDEVKITENAIFLLKNRLVFRLVDLMQLRNPVIREKVCLIINDIATYEDGINSILKRPKMLLNLKWLALKDKKEIRYAAATALRTIAGERCAPEAMMKNPKLVPALLAAVVNERVGIVIIHLRTLERLIEWNPEVALEHNAFQVMMSLTTHDDPRVVCGALDCLAGLLTHEVGRQLADEHDMVFYLRPYLKSKYPNVIIAAASAMRFATITTRSKWRAKEICPKLTNRLVQLAHKPTNPMMQLNSLQILLNLCDCAEFRHHLNDYWEKSIQDIFIGTPAEIGDVLCSSDAVSIGEINTYVKPIVELKQLLLNAMKWKPYREAVTLD